MPNDVVAKTASYVQEKFATEDSGHDWWHMYRVWQLAKTLAANEPDADKLVVELGALLHDIADWKLQDDEEAGIRETREWLTNIGAKGGIADQVEYIIRNISYKGGTNKHVMKTLEGKIVQDADRLDAMGAIGIGRTFAFGGSHGRLMHDPDKKPLSYKSFAEFKKNLGTNTTVNHFYEKLLQLKDGMHTDMAKKLAERRHAVMVQYLEEFYAEWEGER